MASEEPTPSPPVKNRDTETKGVGVGAYEHAILTLRDDVAAVVMTAQRFEGAIRQRDAMFKMIKDMNRRLVQEYPDFTPTDGRIINDTAELFDRMITENRRLNHRISVDAVFMKKVAWELAMQTTLVERYEALVQELQNGRAQAQEAEDVRPEGSPS